MGKPAARLTDMANDCNDPVDMPTGVVISVGTVLINNLPAAKKNDQIVGVDLHIVMVPSPAGPVPTPLPHPFTGIIDGELSSSVKIMGQPAATVGSTASNKPSHIPTPPGTAFQKPPMNKSKIIMGSPNVLIGNGGSGSGSGSGGGEGVAESSADEAAVEEGHTLQVKFVDKGGKPITGVKYSVKSPDNQVSTGSLSGEVKKSGVKEGDHEISLQAITKAEWSKPKARDGEKVKMLVETAGIEDGEKASFEVWERNASKADRLVFSTDESHVDGDKAESEWTYEYPSGGTDGLDQASRGYCSPSYYFTIIIDGIVSRSGLLDYKDYMEIELRDDEDKPVKRQPYELRLSSGEIRRGTLDDNGYAKEEKIPPGRCHVEFVDKPGTVGPE